jgi:ABC-type nitrate/sulfonate/bicarbonate transport systems, periplasmic components
MKRYHPNRRMLLGALGSFPLLAALRAGPARAAPDSPLTLGYPANLIGAGAILAEEEKMFEKVGARVAFQKFNSGVAVRDALVSGRVEVGVMNSTPFVVGVAKGELAGIAVAAYAGKIVMVVGGKDRGIKTIADLKGRKVASQVGSGTDHVFQSVILPKYGLKSSDIQIINVKFENHVSALASRSVDAYAGTEPYSSIAEHEGIGVVVVDYSRFDLTPVMLAVNQPVLEQKRDAVVTLLKGWLETVRFAREQPERAARIIWRFYQSTGYDVPEAVIRSAFGRVDLNPDYVPELAKYFTEQAQVLIDRKQIARMPDWDKELLRGPIDEARAALAKAR